MDKYSLVSFSILCLGLSNNSGNNQNSQNTFDAPRTRLSNWPSISGITHSTFKEHEHKRLRAPATEGESNAGRP